MTSGICFASFTHRGSLIVTVVGGRKWRVTGRKLKMIREELARHKVPPHKVDRKDLAIPISACGFGTAAGVGIDVGLGSFVSIEEFPASGSGDGMVATGPGHGQELQEMLTHPVDTVHGFDGDVTVQEAIVARGPSTNGSVAHLLGLSPGEVPVQSVQL